jgi:hypothetical protein
MEGLFNCKGIRADNAQTIRYWGLYRFGIVLE